MIAADGERVAVAAEHEHVQVGPRQRDAAGKRQRAAVNVVHAVRLHEIREAAGAADAGNGGDLLVPQLALLDQLEVQREHGEIAAAGTPRRMIGGDFLFGQRLALGAGGRRRRCCRRERECQWLVDHSSMLNHDSLKCVCVASRSGARTRWRYGRLRTVWTAMRVVFTAAEDFLHLPGQAVGLVDAADASDRRSGRAEGRRAGRSRKGLRRSSRRRAHG